MPEASCVDPSPSNLHHTPGFPGSDHSGGATGLVARLVVSVVPGELFEAYREEQRQGDYNEDLASNAKLAEAIHVTAKQTGHALRMHN